jgi:hypothetical protein
MKIKEYKVTKDEVTHYLYSLSWDKQMTVNYQFGREAKARSITIFDYILSLIEEGVFLYRGKPVKFKIETP